jgi:coiled-coil and C2 domain-containing protein 2A
MWFNTQQFDEPYRIRFDTSQTKNWRAFFDANNANRFESIQPEQLIYTATSERDRTDLERKIDLEIRAKMRKWRGYRTFHASSSYITAKLRDLLHAMERYSVQMNASNDDAPIKRWLDELAQLQIAHRVTGFPINLPYTNMKAILEAVHATQAHAIPTNDVDYAIAVYVHAYPNSILSVWVYLAVLIKKDATI